MADKRLTMQGVRDYRVVQLPDLIQDIGEHRDLVQETINRLDSLKAGVVGNAEHLDDAEEILQAMDHMLSVLGGIWGDISRLCEELPYGVEDKHLEAVSQIHEACRIEKEGICRGFKEAFICRKLKDESMRGLLDQIHSLYDNRMFNLLVLADINARLRTYLGEGLPDRRTRSRGLKNTGIPDLKIPADTHWEDIKLEFQDHEQLKIFIRNEAYAVKNYEALGFLDSRTARKSPKTGKPIRLWRTLALFAVFNGEISWDNTDQREADKLVKNVSELRDRLKRLFRISGDPITPYERDRNPSYLTVFQITPIDRALFDRIASWVAGPRGSATVRDEDPDEES
jgi:hypothetical protein